MDLTSSVFARPGAPVIRQWPPANSAIRICSITSFWPTMTLPNSASICALPAARRSTVSRCAAEMEIFSGASAIVFMKLVSHQIKNDVDSQRIAALFRKLVKEEIVLAFTFPAIAVVAVVCRKNHEPAFVIVQAAHMHVAALLTVMILPGPISRMIA